MLDKDRQQLAERLRGKIKKANSNVSTKVEAESGEFKVVIASDSLSHIYNGDTVSTIRVAQLDDDLIEYINSDPQDAAQEILDEFVKSFDPMKSSASIRRVAAHETQNEETYQKVTQKQLDDQKPMLHPRKDEYYTNVTQKQLPEHGQRPGTYDITTEGQFRDERETFYGAKRTSGDWKYEDRNTVTERQFDEGLDKYTDIGESDRGEMGAEYDGGLAQQHRQIGEKQLMELLKHHEWTEPLTTTEGKDQLGKQDGELGRLTADVAKKVIKEALDALGNTVLAVGIPPKQLSGIVQRLVSHASKYPALAHTITCYKGTDTKVIENKVAKAQAFGKTANTGSDWSDLIAADVLVRQLSKMAYNSKFVVDALIALAKRDDFSDKINSSADTILTAKSNDKVVEASIFDEVLGNKVADTQDEGSAEDDGLYAYKGTISEVGADTSNQKDFAEKAASYGKEKILEKVASSNLNLIPQMIDVDESAGVFQVQYKDANFGDNSLSVRAEKRRSLAAQKTGTVKETDKTAQKTKTAQMGGAGGMPPAGGADMANPMAPPGGADMGGPPPGEALSQEPPVEEEGAAGGGEPKPPGAVCPVCGGEDVDVDNGEFRCNNCGGEGSISVKFDVSKWPETIQESEGDEEGGFGLDEGLGAEEEAMGEPVGDVGGEGTTLPNVPVGASVRVTPFMIEKLGSQNISLGSVCPNCGGNNTDRVKSASTKGYDGVCYDCYQEFKFSVQADLDKKHHVYANYVWIPKIASSGCSSCQRATALKKAFVKSLENYGMSWNQFDALPSMKAQADTILKMNKAGMLDIKQAMSTPLPIQKTAAASRFDKFPSASCIERLARRMGENATAMSGPCQGKPLAQCVCSQLEGLGIYTDGLAAKVASNMSDKDPLVNAPMQSCLSTMVREGYQVKQACTICDAMRAAYAEPEDLIIETIAQFNPGMKPMPTPGMKTKPMAKPMGAKPMAAPGDVTDPATKPVTSPKAMPAPGAPGMGAKPMGAPGMGGPDMGAKPMGTPGMGSPDMGSPDMGAKPMETPGMGSPGSPPSAAPAPAGPGGVPSPMEPGMGDMQTKPMDAPAPMEMPDPMGEPVMDDMGGELGGMDDGFSMEVDTGLDGMDIGMEGNTVTIELPQQAADALQTLMDALQGNIGDEMIDTTGDELGGELDGGLDGGELGESDELGGEEDLDDVSDITEDTVGDDDSEGDSPFGDSDEGDSDVPGLSDDDDGPEMVKESDPEEGGDESSDMEAKDMEMESNEAPKKMKLVEVAENEEATKTASANELDSLLFSMKRGAIKTQGSALDSVFDGLLRQANIRQAKIAAKQSDGVKKMDYKSASEGSKIKKNPAQDSTEVKYKDGGKIGHEEAFSAATPDVPRAAATLGDEGPENTVSESGDAPTVPHGSKAMSGEEHYRPEKGNEVDGNQSSQTTARNKAQTKTANTEKTMKTAKTWTVAPDHKFYGAFMKKASSGESEVTLTDNVTYNMSMDQNKNIILVAKGLPEALKKHQFGKKDDKDCGMPMKKKDMEAKAQNSKEIKKESQTVSPKSVDKLEDDPDINQSSGAGQGKTHVDKAHSLGVDEKKPSEGMDAPSVPEAPNDGRLAREHTVDKAKDGPEIPAGGGKNSDYDQNEKNDPEKQDQLLGKQNDMAAMASVSRDEAVKIAGQMLKAQMITIDELPSKINELSKATPEILKDYENLIRTANDTKGMRKAASSDSVETPLLQRTAGATNETQSKLKENVQNLFTLEGRNKDFERYAEKSGNPRLYR